MERFEVAAKLGLGAVGLHGEPDLWAAAAAFVSEQRSNAESLDVAIASLAISGLESYDDVTALHYDKCLDILQGAKHAQPHASFTHNVIDVCLHALSAVRPTNKYLDALAAGRDAASTLGARPATVMPMVAVAFEQQLMSDELMLSLPESLITLHGSRNASSRRRCNGNVMMDSALCALRSNRCRVLVAHTHTLLTRVWSRLVVVRSLRSGLPGPVCGG